MGKEVYESQRGALNVFKVEDVCAVVVLYNCDRVILHNVKSLVTQAGHILLVDNGSLPTSLGYIRAIPSGNPISFIHNPSNLGIAEALNQGLAFASSRNFKLILTMDQDSVLSPGCVQGMLDALNARPGLASVGPVYGTSSAGSLGPKYKKVNALITSGNLTLVEAALKVGGFKKELFIDQVDLAFSLDLQDHGYGLVKVLNSFMLHAIGEHEGRNVGSMRYEVRSHSPLRHYYIFRNNIYILRNYFFRHPLICLKNQILLLRYCVMFVLAHSEKGEKMAMMLKGLQDGFVGRYGQFHNN